MSSRSFLSIGDVLGLLKEDFPDVTISKIRFLESQGLLDPERTPSGYRKFYQEDVDKLRWILQQQRENFLPLKVIKGRLRGDPEDFGADIGQAKLDFGDIGESEGLPSERLSSQRSARVGPVLSAQSSARQQPNSQVISRPNSQVESELVQDRSSKTASSGFLPQPPIVARNPKDNAGHTSQPRVPTASSKDTLDGSTKISAKETIANLTRQTGPLLDPRNAPLEPSTRSKAENNDNRAVSPPPTARLADVTSQTAAMGERSQSGPIDKPPQEPQTPVHRQPRESQDTKGLQQAREALGLSTPPPGKDASESRERLGLKAPTANRPVAPVKIAPTPQDQVGNQDLSEDSVDSNDEVSLTLAELANAAGLPNSVVEELMTFGLISGRSVAGTTFFSEDALTVARLCAGFAKFGIGPRHIRIYKLAAEREVGLFEQVVVPILKQKNPDAKRNARQSLLELSRLGQQMRTAMVRSVLNSIDG